MPFGSCGAARAQGRHRGVGVQSRVPSEGTRSRDGRRWPPARENQDFWHPDTPMAASMMTSRSSGRSANGKLLGLERRLSRRPAPPFAGFWKRYAKTSDDVKENADLVGEGKIKRRALRDLQERGGVRALREALRHRRVRTARLFLAAANRWVCGGRVNEPRPKALARPTETSASPSIDGCAGSGRRERETGAAGGRGGRRWM